MKQNSRYMKKSVCCPGHWLIRIGDGTITHGGKRVTFDVRCAGCKKFSIITMSRELFNVRGHRLDLGF